MDGTRELIYGGLEFGHEDARRRIDEKGNFHVYRIGTDPRALGNHFHRKTPEGFLLLEGEGYLVYCFIDENGQALGDQVTLRITAPWMVEMQTFTAHAFLLQPGSLLISYADFDPDDMPGFPLNTSGLIV